MRKATLFLMGLILFAALPHVMAQEKSSAESSPHKLIEILSEELDYSMKNLAAEDGTKPYYLAYTITDTASLSLRGRLGALATDDTGRTRLLDVDCRVGDYALDSTRQIRGGRGRGGFSRLFGGGAAAVAIEDSEAAIKHAVWMATDSAFKTALDRLQQVETNLKTMVEEENPVGDFSREKPSIHFEGRAALAVDRSSWAERIRRISRIAKEYPLILASDISLSATAENRFMVTSEGTRLQTGRKLLRIVVSASTRAEDGMDLSQSFIFDAASAAGLPTEEAVGEAFRKVIDKVLALREAPLVEPYVGPAILRNRASGVFFHEIFGHRIEGHRQKNIEEGQTFTKMVGKYVLPDFVNVYDDPTLARFNGQDLRGYYLFDDEGVPSSRVDLVEKGILNTFLMSRSPLDGFPSSNGHGRREPGRSAVSRQGNLIIQSDRVVPFDELREMLKAECKKQGKPFGFIFEDITGGFTTTQRSGPQAFKVLPVVVYRVFADDRPDELVRGVDIVGTPLSCFSKILCCSDDAAVFNGSCGAESGWVPVSAVSPSILVEQIEIEKSQRSQERLPILPSPVGSADEAGDPILQALEDELERSMSLKIEDLEQPYFVQYGVNDRSTQRLSATCGAIVTSDTSRSRSLSAQVRVGSYELDNTNFSGGGGDFFGRRGGGRRSPGGGGGSAMLPIEDDYLSIRKAAWLATDSQYKSAVETFTQKKAYMEDREFNERTADFTKHEAVNRIEPRVARPELDEEAWKNNLRQLSARFLQHRDVRTSAVNLTVGAGNTYLINSEGSRIRRGETGVQLSFTASVQSAKGETLSDSKTYLARTPAGLPGVDALSADVDALVKGLRTSVNAKVLDDYAGPVLFDGTAAPQLFDTLLTRGLAGRPPSVGEGRRRFSAMENLAKYLGRRILPRSFQVFDDPTVGSLQDTVLAGFFLLDDEGVPSRRVDLVKDGKLEALLMSRTPTRELAQTNGHGRGSGRAGGSRAAVGNLFVQSSEGLSRDDLMQALREAADDQGLDFGLRVASLGGRSMGGMRNFGRGRFPGGRMPSGFGRGQGGGGSSLGDPVHIYKVFVGDGREEPVRGCEFASISVSVLRDIIAAGDTPFISNRGGLSGSGGTSIIASPVIIEEVELYAIEQERQRKPFMEMPHARGE